MFFLLRTCGISSCAKSDPRVPGNLLKMTCTYLNNLIVPWLMWILINIGCSSPPFPVHSKFYPTCETLLGEQRALAHQLAEQLLTLAELRLGFKDIAFFLSTAFTCFRLRWMIGVRHVQCLWPEFCLCVMFQAFPSSNFIGGLQRYRCSLSLSSPSPAGRKRAVAPKKRSVKCGLERIWWLHSVVGWWSLPCLLERMILP